METLFWKYEKFNLQSPFGTSYMARIFLFIPSFISVKLHEYVMSIYYLQIWQPSYSLQFEANFSSS